MLLRDQHSGLPETTLVYTSLYPGLSQVITSSGTLTLKSVLVWVINYMDTYAYVQSSGKVGQPCLMSWLTRVPTWRRAPGAVLRELWEETIIQGYQHSRARTAWQSSRGDTLEIGHYQMLSRPLTTVPLNQPTDQPNGIFFFYTFLSGLWVPPLVDF